MGGNLEPETLLTAYAGGIFPWYAAGQPILWWSPDPRMVLFADEFHCSRRLARRLRQRRYRFSLDEAFADVIRGCAFTSRKGETDTWLVAGMISAYEKMHRLGYAHSLEVWDGPTLIGGLYGVLYRQVFFAESMFSRRTDASKMALARLVDLAGREGWRMIDCQFYTAHLASLGAREIPRQRFLELIDSR